MRKTHPPFHKLVGEVNGLLTADLTRLANSWYTAGEINPCSERATQLRRDLLNKLAWFLNHKSLDVCDIAALRASPYLPIGRAVTVGNTGSKYEKWR